MGSETQMLLFGMQSKRVGTSAVFSPCRTWRYALWRVWDPSAGYCMFIGLNPSTADETSDDPTVRRCIGFAKAWGYGALCMTNLFAYRTKSPAAMKKAWDPVGIDTDAWLGCLSRRAGTIVAAWGNDGAFMGRGDEIIGKFHDNKIKLCCLAITNQGQPGHPLYLPKTSTLRRLI